MKAVFSAAAFVAVVLLVGAPAHAVTLVLPRAGQTGVGLQFQGGGLAETGELGNEFSTGVGFGAVRLKYRTRYDRAAGISFETRRLDGRGRLVTPSAFTRDTGPDSLAPLEAVTLQTYGVDFYQFFGTRTRMQGFLSVSGGLAKINAWAKNGDPVYPLAGDGVFLGVGAGMERFVYRSWAVDFSTRYAAVFLDGSTNHDVQVALGMIFYAAY
jgi:hypothetical protein